MKFYRDKSFGYPVLKTPALEVEEETDTKGGAEAEEDTSDYLKGIFQCGVKWRVSGVGPEQLCCFAYNFKTSVCGLTKAVKDGDVAYFLRVQCSDAYFSQVEQVEPKGELSILANHLSGETEITAFIVAVKNTTIESDQIHPDFDTKKFDVKTGMVLAHQAPITYDIKKNPSPILDYWPEDEMEEGRFEIVLGEQREPVYVRANSKHIESFRRASVREGKARAVLYNSVVFVAVMEMFRALIDDTDQSYKDTRWAKVLIATYKRYGEEINDKTDIVRATQIILKMPLDSLSKKFYSKL